MSLSQANPSDPPLPGEVLAGDTLESAIDAARLGPLQITTYLLCTAVMLIDGYDLVAMPFAVPHIVERWGWEASSFGPVLAAVLVGLGAGALLLGPFGDRFGRRPLILSSVAVAGLATIGTATATSIGGFVFWRLLTGIALGAGLANVPALISELTPQRRRAGILTLVSCGIAIGGVLAGFLTPALVAASGWQGLFVGPGVATLAIAVVLYAFLPESPKFLHMQGDDTRLARISARLRLPATHWPQYRKSASRERSSLLAPFRAPHRFAAFVFMGLYAINALILYALVSWMPTLLAQSGFPLDRTSQLASLIQLGGLVSGPILSWFLDRKKAAVALVVSYVLIGATLIGFSAVLPTTAGWGALLLIAGGGVSGTHLAIMALGATFFPPRILASALGLGIAVARIGAIAGPLIGGVLIGFGASPPQFLAMLVLPVLLCGGLALLVARVVPRPD